MANRLTQLVFESVISTASKIRLTQVPTEVVETPTSLNARLSQLPTEAAIAPVPKARLSSLPVEVAIGPSLGNYITQLPVEVAEFPLPKARLSSLIVEVAIAPVLIVPAPATLTLVSYAPSIIASIVPPTATLVLTGYAPTINITSAISVLGDPVLEVDWNNDGDFNDPLEDCTPDLIDRQAAVCERGKDQIRLLSPPMAGSFGCELQNPNRIYSAENPSSPLAGSLIPGRKVRLHLAAAGADYPLFTGVLDDVPQHPEWGRRSVELRALGSLSRLRGKELSTALFEGITTGAAIGHILDAAGWPPLERVISTGQVILNQFWLENQDAFEAIATILSTEGPGSSVYERADGFFVFEDNQYRLTAPRCIGSQFTFSALDYILPDGYSYDAGMRDIINATEVSVTTRSTKEESVVWQYGKTLVINPSETVRITAQANDPFKDAVTPSPSSGINAIQRLTILGTAPQIRLSFRDEQTVDIGSTSGGPTAAGIQAALEALSSINPGDVSVIRSSIGVDKLGFDIIFQGDLGHQPIELLGVSGISLSGKAMEVKIVDLTVGKVDDFKLLGGSIASLTLNRTSGQSVTIEIVAGGAGAYIDGLQLRAKPVTSDSQKRIINSLDASVSQSKYGIRSSSPSTRPEISEEAALNLANNIVRYYQDPRPILRFTAPGSDGTIQLQQLKREISDRITIVESYTGIDGDWFIEQIKHSLLLPIFLTEFGCEKVGNLSVAGGSGQLWDTAVWDSASWGS